MLIQLSPSNPNYEVVMQLDAMTRLMEVQFILSCLGLTLNLALAGMIGFALWQYRKGRKERGSA